ncbi:MAG TPA: hypothetical protein VMW49_01750, partial [Candidatus Dormibacteraeota bacterium]|nr:hypothetical protein [Candidatus Dormibacteraeota bacterium]
MATVTVHDTPLWGEYDVNDSRLGAYCDFLALVPAPTGGDTAVAASFLGPDTAVRGLLAVASAQRSPIAFRLPTSADEEAGTPIASAFVRGDRQRMVTLGAGVTHGIASGPTSVQDLADGHRTLVVLALDGDLARAVWQILWEATALPLAVDWAPALPAVLARHGVLVVARVHRAAAFAHPAAQVAVLDCDPVRLAAVISAAVRAGDLPIPPARIPYDSAAIPARLDDYLVAHGPALLRYLHRALPARHGAADPDDPRLAAFVRSPFPAQAMVTQGLAKTLAAEGAAIVSGEMGVGKTLMMAGATYLRHARPFRALVLCPPHLVPKWSREVGTTVPGATVTVLRSFGDLVRLRRLVGLTPTRPEFYVMARSQMARSATLGFAGVPATLRGALAQACPGLSGYRCPDCGAFLVTVTEGSRAEDDTSLRVWTAPFVRAIRKSNARCPACQTPLWAPVGAAAANRRAFLRGRAVAAPSANRSFRPYQYVKQHLRGVFDTLIVDEIHEYKGDTNRGSALGTLAAACGDVLMGTGTILG